MCNRNDSNCACECVHMYKFSSFSWNGSLCIVLYCRRCMYVPVWICAINIIIIAVFTITPAVNIPRDEKKMNWIRCYIWMTHSIRSIYQANKMSASVLWDRFHFCVFFHWFGCASKHLHRIFYSFRRTLLRIVWVSKNYIDSIRCHSNISHGSWLSVPHHVYNVHVCLCVLIFNRSHRMFALFGYERLIVFVVTWNIYLFCASICLCNAIEREKWHFQFNKICTREKKTNKIEHVVRGD